MEDNNGQEQSGWALADRQRWMGILARAACRDLEAFLDQLPDSGGYDFLRLPEIGLSMVRGRAGGTGDPFNLGEMTVTRCSLRLADGTVGHGYIKGRDKRHCELAALFDALLQRDEYRQDLFARLIDPLEKKWLEKRHERSRKAAATKVEFYTMVRGED
nr:phosphonate C-P lyase system protein PhnG [Aestuariispira insulae]